MEKYSAWRDKETGIHPLFHPKEKESRFILRPVLDVLLFVIRTPLLIMLFSIYFLVRSVVQLIPLPSFLKRPLIRIIDILGCRSTLFLLGFWWIKSNYQRISRQYQLPKIYPPGINISSGDLIVSNKLSIVEILYLGFRYSPVFTGVSIEGDALKRIGIFRALLDALRPTSCYHLNDGSYAPLQSILDTARSKRQGPVVVFPEGTNSNGRALLDYCPVLDDVSISQLRTHVIGFKFEWSYFCPVFTVGSSLGYLYHLMGQVKNSLQVRYLSPNDIPANPQADNGSSQDWGNEVFSALANTLRLKRTKINQTDKQEFLEYWAQANKKSYTKRS